MIASRQRLVAFVQLSRLHFLAGGFLMFAIGVFSSDAPSIGTYLLAQLMVSAAQLTAHYTNEYADFEADAFIENRTNFSGGSGILQSGVLDRSVALKAAFVTSAICIITAVLVSINYPVAAALGVIALGVSWAYSMPPIRLLSTGTGEVFTSLTVAGLVPAVGSQVATHSIPHPLSWCIATLVCIHMSMLLAFELPDLATDELAGKRVLGVRVGAPATRVLIVAFTVLGDLIALIAYLTSQIAASTFMATCVSVPLIALIAVLVYRQRHSLMTFASVAMFFLTGLAFLVCELQQGGL